MATPKLPPLGHRFVAENHFMKSQVNREPDRVMSIVDYHHFLEADRVALGRQPLTGFGPRRLLALIFPDEILCFQRSLRRLEYLTNRRQTVSVRLRRGVAYWRYRRLSRRLGFTIPVNVFGPGLSIAHAGTIVVNKGARVGANCRLHVCVNIGTAAGEATVAPQIGDNVYIGPGAKIFGPITVPDNCAIGANAVVNKTVHEPCVLIAGVPARSLGPVDVSTMLLRISQSKRAA